MNTESSYDSDILRETIERLKEELEHTKKENDILKFGQEFPKMPAKKCKTLKILENKEEIDELQDPEYLKEIIIEICNETDEYRQKCEMLEIRIGELEHKIEQLEKEKPRNSMKLKYENLQNVKYYFF
jgi:hypothetical protein